MQTEEIEFGYKVVWVNKKKHKISPTYFWNERSVRYHLGKWVVPIEGNGPLTVFKTPLSARNYAFEVFTKDQMPYIKIYKCQWIKSKHHILWCLTKKRNKTITSITPFPWKNKEVGFADKVMLTRLVAKKGI
jgi:hypothetical protein